MYKILVFGQVVFSTTDLYDFNDMRIMLKQSNWALEVSTWSC